MRNTSGIPRLQRKEDRKAKLAKQLKDLGRYWVFIRKPQSQYAKLVPYFIGDSKSNKVVIRDGMVMNRETIYDVTRVY